MNKQIAVAMAVAMAVFLTAAFIGTSADDTDAAGPYEFTVDYDDYSISFYASEQASEGVNGTAYITNVTIYDGSTAVELELPETVIRSDTGYEGTYNVTGIGTKGYAMVVFSTENGAANIKSIMMPDTYTWLTSQAFVYCSNLESVKLSAGLESIEEQTFSSITRPYISDGNIVTEVIAPGTQITSIDIPEGIKTIGVGAFKDCPTLTHVSIPSSVTTIGKDSFRNTGLISVEIEAADVNNARSIESGAFASNEGLTAISIPEGFTYIGSNAFLDCESIEEATVPSTVEEMWNSVFEGCSSLETISFEGDTVFKGSSIFNNCSSLKSVDLHEGMSGYTISQFSGCTSLEEVVIPEGFTKIDRSMFNGCTSLTDVTIPASAKSVDDEAFNGCTSLRTVTFTGTEPPTISSGTFGTNIEFIVPEGSEDVYQTALDTATGGTVSINDYVAEVGEEKFLTIQAAIDSIATSGFVILLKDATESVTVVSGKEIILNLGIYKLINTDGYHTITVESGSTLTIQGTGTVDNVSHGKAAVWNDGTVILNGGTYTRSQENGQDSETSGGNSYYNIVNHGNMTINEGVKVTQNGHYSSMIENGWYNGSENTGGEDSVMVINGGEFSGGLNTVKNDDYGNLTINDGTFENISQAAILNWNVAVIEDGDFTVEDGADAIIVNGYGNDTMDKGVLTIKGGTFVGPVGLQCLGGTTPLGEVIIEDGDFTGTDQTFGNLGTNPEISVRGGSFSSDVTDYCEPGFAPVLDPVTGDYIVDVDKGALEVSVESVIGYVVGGAAQTYEVEYVSDLAVVWSSSDESVVKVSDGVITFIGGDEAIVTASVTLVNGQTLTAEISVIVYEVPAVSGIEFEPVTNESMSDSTFEEAMADMPWDYEGYAMFGISGSETFTVPYDVLGTFGWTVTSENYTDYEFAVIHFPTSDTYEFPEVTASADGLTVTVDSHSPFYFFYRLAETEVEPDQPVVPFPDDDDYVPLPPTIVYEDDGSDSTASIAACAAAAVVAAILAIVLASTYRRK